MTTITAKEVAALREQSGAGMMDCKKALVEAEGNNDKAMELLRAKGLKSADKKSGRNTAEGRVHSYIHHNCRVGVLLEIACETDFVARGEAFTQLLDDICMHIAAHQPAPIAVDVDAMDSALVEEERRQLLMADDIQNKPEEIRDKIVAGRLEKFIAERALLSQEFVKDPELTVEGLLKQAIGKLGENMRVVRFARFELGA